MQCLRNDPYTHFSQQFYNKLTWMVIFYYFFTKTKQNKTKIIKKYYQSRQLVVGLLWEMSVRIIFLFWNIRPRIRGGPPNTDVSNSCNPSATHVPPITLPAKSRKAITAKHGAIVTASSPTSPDFHIFFFFLVWVDSDQKVCNI
jgi:hypothetical protein